MYSLQHLHRVGSSKHYQGFHWANNVFFGVWVDWCHTLMDQHISTPSTRSFMQILIMSSNDSYRASCCGWRKPLTIEVLPQRENVSPQVGPNHLHTLHIASATYGGFLKWRYPNKDGLHLEIPVKWVTWGHPYFRKPPMLPQKHLKWITHGPAL